jgi:hypothetical protein
MLDRVVALVVVLMSDHRPFESPAPENSGPSQSTRTTPSSTGRALASAARTATAWSKAQLPERGAEKEELKTGDAVDREDAVRPHLWV